MSADKDVAAKAAVPLLTAEIAHAWCDADEVELLVPPNELIDGREAIAEGRSQVCIVPTRPDLVDAIANALGTSFTESEEDAAIATLAQYGFNVEGS